MKSLLIKSLSLVLFLIMSALMMFSCNITDEDIEYCNHTTRDFFPEGYTCGFPLSISQVGPELEYWWVETYEECLSAIELLKSHDSTFVKSILVKYEGELFDVKYCFKISTCYKDAEKIEFGENPFDRKAIDVEITSFMFCENVSIDEIVYSDVYDYDFHTIGRVYDLFEYDANSLSFEAITYEYRQMPNYPARIYVYDAKSRKMLFSAPTFHYAENPGRAEEMLRSMINTLEYVE